MLKMKCILLNKYVAYVYISYGQERKPKVGDTSLGG